MTKKELTLEINNLLNLIGETGIKEKRLMRCPKDALIALYGSLLSASIDIIEKRR